MQLKQTKSELRKELKAKRTAVASNGYRSEAGAAIVRRITELDKFIGAEAVLMFYPVASEVDILPLFAAARALGKKVAFPRSLEGGRLSFGLVNDISELSAMAHGIPEPAESSPVLLEFECSVCITPALAFDADGYRIGYGGGYYDRFLASYTGIPIGVAYDDMISDALPRDDLDLPVNIIITERRILRPCRKK